ncbi:hypothetical protein BFP70_01500 [Thioclava sp. SK-1]|uniref:phosphopantetheine-binding protein n=1 Tax=Thioclava sp. SK-1 TaxID=1889770 RepID=UPI0008251BA6|nr:phosphopantetheine-binding protein [Thioclava sp. SK-1]OCX61281.1 hypothetical protein BFP70_01500 [Thioclava sp. SK-1]
MSFHFDTIRTDVAQALFMAPDDIGMEDNLGDLGLDSMRIMTLVLGWQDKGLTANFLSFAEDQTLAAWKAAFDAQQTNDA